MTYNKILGDAVDRAMIDGVAKLFQVLHAGIIQKTPDAQSKFKEGLKALQETYEIAQGVISAP